MEWCSEPCVVYGEKSPETLLSYRSIQSKTKRGWSSRRPLRTISKPALKRHQSQRAQYSPKKRLIRLPALAAVALKIHAVICPAVLKPNTS